jgi:hypothetical protein
MTAETERNLSRKLDDVSERLHQMNLTLVSYMAKSESCSKKCHDTHKAVFGNGSMGLKAKVWVLWGVSAATFSGVIMLIVEFAKRQLN